MHLRVCAGCQEVYEELVVYYREVEKGLKAAEEDVRSQVVNHEKLPVRMERQKKREYQRESPLRVEVAFPVRAGRWIAHHPYASGGSALGVIALALILTFVLPKLKLGAMNPDHIVGKNDSLLVLNKDGQVLWEALIGYDLEYARSILKTDQALRSSIAEVIDIDNDGYNEMIVVGGAPGFPAIKLPLRGLIFCYNSDGSVRWKRKMGREVVFGDKKYDDDYLTVCFQTGDYDNDGKLDILVYAHHSTWEPAVVSLLDAKDGSVRGEYWHRGHIQAILTDDLDSDGTNEILIAGQNNSFNSASVVVLDPRHMAGYAPTTKLDTLQGGIPGTEKYFICLPMSDVGKAVGSHVRNIASELRATENAIVVEVIEGSVPHLAAVSLYYSFDRQMRCLRVDPSDVFRSNRDRLLREGKLPPTTGNYYETLKKSVLYWDGETFVHQPTINSRYLEAATKR